MKLNKLVLAALLVSSISGILLLNKKISNPALSTPIPTSTSTPQVSQTVTINIHFDGQKVNQYTLNYTTSTSALTTLQLIAAQNAFPVDIKKYSFGTLVESINDLKNTQYNSWIYFVNGQSASVGADSYIISPGDIIDWKYLKPY